jgi:hypothetical protein
MINYLELKAPIVRKIDPNTINNLYDLDRFAL